MAENTPESLLDEVQQVLRLALPNLVYRRLAAEQLQFFQHAWALSQPVAQSTWLMAAGGEVAEEAESTPVTGDLPTPRGALEVIEAFGRMNPPNLVLLQAWLDALRGQPAHDTSTVLQPRQDLRPPPLPPMVATDSHPLLHTIAAASGGQYPSAWRILAHWPGYFEQAWTIASRNRQDGQLDRAVERICAATRTRAAVYPRSLQPLADTTSPWEAERPRIIDLLASFAEDLIPRLIGELALLRARARLLEN